MRKRFRKTEGVMKVSFTVERQLLHDLLDGVKGPIRVHDDDSRERTPAFSVLWNSITFAPERNSIRVDLSYNGRKVASMSVASRVYPGESVTVDFQDGIVYEYPVRFV
jgi:hypothetical protein